MVVAYMLLAVDPLRVLYRRSFLPVSSPEPELEDIYLTEAEGLREARTWRLLDVAERVRDEHSFARACKNSGSVYDSDFRVEASEQLDLLEEKGVFRAPSGHPVVWATFHPGLQAHALVLEETENRLLAENVLRCIGQKVRVHAPLALQMEHKNCLVEMDKVAAVINHFLPSGVMLHMTSRVVRQREKLLEKFLK